MVLDLLARMFVALLTIGYLSVRAPVTPPVAVSAPANCTEHADVAGGLLDTQAYDEALALLDRAVRDCPDDAVIAHLHSVASYKRYESRYTGATPGDADAADIYAALGEMSRSILLAPDTSDSYFYRGLIFTSLQEPDHALLDYNRAIELDPESPYAYYSRGLLYETRGDSGLAALDYRRFLDLYALDDNWRADVVQRLESLTSPRN